MKNKQLKSDLSISFSYISWYVQGHNNKMEESAHDAIWISLLNNRT